MLLQSDPTKTFVLTHVKDLDGSVLQVRIPMELSQQWLEFQLLKAAKGYCPLHVVEYQQFMRDNPLTFI